MDNIEIFDSESNYIISDSDYSDSDECVEDTITTKQPFRFESKVIGVAGLFPKPTTRALSGKFAF